MMEKDKDSDDEEGGTLPTSFMESNKEPDKDKDLNDYEVLRDDYPTYDLAFKVIIIGDSGKKKFL